MTSYHHLKLNFWQLTRSLDYQNPRKVQYDFFTSVNCLAYDFYVASDFIFPNSSNELGVKNKTELKP